VFEQLKVEEEISSVENLNATSTDNIDSINSEKPDNEIQSRCFKNSIISIEEGTQLPDKKSQRKIKNLHDGNNKSRRDSEEFSDWNCMENFDNLIEIEIKNLISNNGTNNNKKETSISPSSSTNSNASTSAVSSFTSKKNIVDNDNNNNNILKLEKHVSEYTDSGFKYINVFCEKKVSELKFH
jgi:hypothetical protein